MAGRPLSASQAAVGVDDGPRPLHPQPRHDHETREGDDADCQHGQPADVQGS